MSNLSQFFGSGTTSSERMLGMFPRLFGDGSYGSGTIGVNTEGGHLSAFGVRQYTDLTISAGVTLSAATGTSYGGIFIAVSGTLTLDGTISAVGGNATNATATTSGNAGAGAGGPAGGASKTVEGAGTNGALSTTPTGAGGPGGSGAYSASNNAYSGGNGVGLIIPTAANPWMGIRLSSGLLLPSAYTTQSATGGTSTAASTVQTALGSSAATGFLLNVPIAGCGGGAGGANSGAVSNTCGGSGGGGGGHIYIEARTVAFGGACAISVAGGNGGNAARDGAGSASGGRGGAGGRVIIICREYTGTPPTINVSGGTGGTGVGSGAAGGSGASGDYAIWVLGS